MKKERKRKKEKESKNLIRHLLDGGVVELLQFLEGTEVLLGHEIDGHTLSPETSTTTNPVDVVFQVAGEVIVDDQGHLRRAKNKK